MTGLLRTVALHHLPPGVVLCGAVAMAAGFVTQHHGASTVLFGLSLIMAFNCVDPVRKLRPGVTFSPKTLLWFS